MLDTLGQYLRSTRDPRKALAFTLREGRTFFQAASGCIAVAQAGERDARLLLGMPRDDGWDLEHIGRFIRHTRPPVRRDLVLAPIRRRGAAWGAMAFRRPSPPFDHDDGRLLARITAAVSDAVQSMDRERMLDVRDRIDRQIMELIHPKDLFYQILDGLRSLTHYDHSSALLIRERGEDTLRLVAEQIAWTKARSRHIGLTLRLDAELEPVLASAEIHGFDRHGDDWQAWTGKPVTRLAGMLDYNRDSHDGAHAREASMLCAPLVVRDGMIGILKVASRYPGRLKPFDAELVDRFRSQAAVAIQNLTRTESLQARMLTAERKHAMADLARTVSHDVNNALGAMLPLIQQMQAELQAGRMDQAVYLEDLDQVQKSVQACRRIFGGMLSFARGGARRSHHGEVSPALETTLAVLKDGMRAARHRTGRRRRRRSAAGGVRAGRSRAGIPEPPDQRARGQRAGRRGHRPRATRAGAHRDRHRRQRLRDRAGGPPASVRAVLYDQDQRQRPRPLHLPLDPVGDRRHAGRPERTSQGNARPGDRPLGASDARARRTMKRPARILVVDDEFGMVRAVERVLAGAHEVVGSHSSPEALTLARQFDPDLVVLDVRMPEIDGFELMARLKADLPGVDIIVMTGSLDDLDQKLIRAIRGRAFYFIQKPFDREVLLTLVERCLELRWRRLESRQHVERLERELAEARAFQQGLLPLPDMVVDQLAVSCRYVSCAELGGDLCDYVAIGPGRIALLVADVMGHGVSAAMLTGVVKSAFRASSPQGYEPQAMVRRLWRNMECVWIGAVRDADRRRRLDGREPRGLRQRRSPRGAALQRGATRVASREHRSAGVTGLRRLRVGAAERGLRQGRSSFPVYRRRLRRPGRTARLRRGVDRPARSRRCETVMLGCLIQCSRAPGNNPAAARRRTT